MGILINQGRQIGGLSEQDQANIGKVTQTETTTDAEYEILFSGTADNTTRTEGAGKSEGMTYNANHKALTIGTRFPNSTIGDYSVSTGYGSTASGEYSHAEGSGTRATGQYSHAEGGGNTASGVYSHAAGGGTTASGDYSHTEGGGTTASGMYSHVEGGGTVANHAYQHVFGMYNTPDPSANSADQKGNYIEIVGNGTLSGDGSTINTSNARTLDWSGNETIKGNLTVGGTSISVNGKTVAHSGNVSTGDSNGQVKIAGTNVSVKGLAAAAYKGVFSRSSVGDIGWGTEANRTKVLEVNAIAFWNGRHSGTSSNLQYCDRGRFGTIVTKNTGDYLPINPANIEFTNKDWHFLDFHWQGSTDDFTARLIESSKGTMRLYYRILTNERVTIENQYGGIIMYHGTGSCVSQMRTGGKGVIEFLQTGGYGTWATCKAKAFSVQSSKWIKENINDLTDEEALKLLNLRPVTFDYTDGVTKNCRGLIAEEAYEELPYCVDMPEEYLNLDHDPILKADKDEDTDIGILPSIDYSKFVPHLIKLCQIQQKQIDELTERLDNLNKN